MTHDQFFLWCKRLDPSLSWPEKSGEHSRGKNIPFTLQQYKEDLQKPLSKIDLHLCNLCAYDIMNREIATKDNELKQSLDMFNTRNFLGHGGYDDENLNDDVLLTVWVNQQTL